MRDHNLEKRMEFLKKSYERVPSTFDPEEVLRKIDEEAPKNSHDKKQTPKMMTYRKRVTVWLVSIASVFIFGFFTASFLLIEKHDQADENNENITRAFLSDLEEKYQKGRSKQQTLLKMESERFEGLLFVKRQDERMSFLLNYDFAKKDASRAEMEMELSKAIEGLKLPSEMIEELGENPLDQDEEASILFLTVYREKMKELIHVYNEILLDNEEEIQNFIVEAPAEKAEVMMLSRKQFSAELQNMIDTMKDQSVRLYDSGGIQARYYESGLHREMQVKLHDNSMGYLNMIAREPFLEGGIARYPVEESLQYVLEMQTTLLTSKQGTDLYRNMESEFVTLFFDLVKGSTKIMDEQGFVKDEYKEIWKVLSNDGYVTPTAYLLKPIVKEMEKTDWRASASWDAFDHDKIKNVLAMARQGELEQVMYGERPVVRDHTITLPDSEFELQVMQLYEEFKQTLDKSMFKGMSPIYVVGVFNYANEMEDPETMLHLYSENSAIYHDESGEEFDAKRYMKNWQKGFSLFKDIEKITFSADTLERYDERFSTYVQMSKEGEVLRTLNLELDKNQFWHIQQVFFDPLPSYEVQPETPIDENFMNGVRHTYQTFSKHEGEWDMNGYSAATVAAVFLYAAEMEEYELQYDLRFHDKDHSSEEKGRVMKEAAMREKDIIEEAYKSISFQAEEQGEDGKWRGVATLTRNPKKGSDAGGKQLISMVWTDKGWKVEDIP